MVKNELNPYIGPRPFEHKKEDTDRFFGRSNETQEIISLIFGHPITLVYAQSGAGKTSLFNASIVVQLEENNFDVLPLTRVGGVLPAGVALQEVKNLYIFNSLLKMDPETDPLEQKDKTLTEFLKKRARKTNGVEQSTPRAIIFDQFEELFTHTPENWRNQRNNFFNQIVEALENDPLLRIVFVIREDFLAELDPYARNLPDQLRARYRLERLAEDAALHAIRDPLLNTGRRYAPGVAEGLVDELLAMRTVDATGKLAEIEGQYIEPVQLQVVCVTLWSSLDTEVTEIQQTHLQNFDVSDALSNFYETTVSSASKETGVLEVDLRNWFGKTLITPMGTRSTVFRGEETTGGINNSAVVFLESRHIIRAEYRAGAHWYELTHDRLVKPILDNNKIWESKHTSLFQQGALLWNERGRSDGLLLRGKEMADAEAWINANKDNLSSLEEDYLKACLKLKAREKRERGRNRLLLFSAIGAVIAMVVAFVFSVQSKNNEQLALEKEQLALENAQIAQTAIAQSERSLAQEIEMRNRAEYFAGLGLAHQLIDQSLILQDSRYDLALLLGLEAYRLGAEIPDTRGNILANLNSPNLLAFSNAHTDTVKTVAVSPDGRIVASGSYDDTIIIWDIFSDPNSPKQLSKLSGHTNGIESVAFSPDSQILASGSDDNKIILWDISNPESPEPFGSPLEGHTDLVWSVAFNPDGQILASGSVDNTIILWDVEDPSSPMRLGDPLEGHTDTVYSVSISPDGNTLVSGSRDNTIILWNIKDPESPEPYGDPLEGHSDRVYSVSISPDGKTLASGSWDGTVILWDISNLEEPYQIGEPISSGSNAILSVSFDQTGNKLASGSWKEIILWDVSDLYFPKKIGAPLDGHTKWIYSVAFSSNGKILVSGGSDNTVRFWNTSSPKGPLQLGEPLTYTSSIYSLAVSPSGRIAASGGSDNRVVIWDISDLSKPSQLSISPDSKSHTEIVSYVAFSPDGRMVASGSYDYTIILWDISDPASIKQIGEPLKGHSDDIETVAFGPDSQVLASGSSDNTIILWDISDPESPKPFGDPLEGHTDIVYSVAISPDGKTLASGSWDDTIILWDISDPKSPEPIGEPLHAHHESVNLVKFSPDGKILASGSYKEIILWDVSDPKTPKQIGVPLIEHSNWVYSVTFSPDGKLMASSGSDNTIVLWDISNSLLPTQLGTAFTGHTDTIYSVVFSTNGNVLISGSSDKTIRIWDVNVDSWAKRICALVKRNLSRSEWELYLPDIPYPTIQDEATCPEWPIDTGVKVTPSP